MKITTTHCDYCKNKVDYYDSDGERYERGFTLMNKASTVINFSNHCTPGSGNSTSYMKQLVIPRNICSKICMISYFEDWFNSIPVITDGRTEKIS